MTGLACLQELGSQTGDKVSSMHDRTGACILRLPELDSRKDIDRVVACYLALNCSVIGWSDGRRSPMGFLW